MNKLLASLMLIVAGVVGAQNITTLDPSQVYSTGNLVNNTTSPTNVTSTWQNVGLMNQGLPCWAPGDPGCGPQPYFNNGSFNFSYGVTDVYQIANIAAALPNSGTGLRVNGYNFGFTAKNGNGWDGGGLDTLSAYVTFYGNDGKTVRNDYYNLNYKFDWSAFNLSKTFDTPYANKDLSNVRYGFVGGDTSNYWAGPYGPEIINISFSLKYSVDPCYDNPLYSPTCPGYLEALTKITAPTTPTADPTTVSSTSDTPTSTVTVETIASPTSPTVTVTSTSTTSAAASNTSASSSSSATTTTQASSNNKESASSTNNLSLGLGVVAKNQQREQNIAAQAVQTATSTAAEAAAASQQEAASVAAQAVANSTSSSAVSSSAPQSSAAATRTSATTSAVLSVGTAPGIQASTVLSTVTGPTSILVNQSTTTQSAATDTTTSISSNMLLDRANPLNQIINSLPAIPGPAPTVSTGPVVNRNTANNEAAGNVDLTKMAVAPADYNSYLNFTLRDSAFYAPREVYKNQRNVDNARAYRSLANDRVHQEMIEQQYRR